MGVHQCYDFRFDRFDTDGGWYSTEFPPKASTDTPEKGFKATYRSDGYLYHK